MLVGLGERERPRRHVASDDDIELLMLGAQKLPLHPYRGMTPLL